MPGKSSNFDFRIDYPFEFDQHKHQQNQLEKMYISKLLSRISDKESS